MKKIVLEIEDEIFNDLEQGVIVKSMIGSLFGTQDEFIVLLIKAIKENKENVSIIKKKKVKSKKHKKLKKPK